MQPCNSSTLKNHASAGRHFGGKRHAELIPEFAQVLEVSNSRDKRGSVRIWTVALEEIGKRWLRGPYSEGQEKELCQAHRRYCVDQQLLQ